ncbi:hypothetical protein BpHYR1_036854 [Brachionus plicatilis]|uniref:Uncharacterized protein n=1 Tax=Brachionus plicatilis TaxID=10195 RepID=A0A3M7RNH5_BRAPC|nr:hypothetical protein BpHYR1_036854 [Brachionus plicatilis]
MFIRVDQFGQNVSIKRVLYIETFFFFNLVILAINNRSKCSIIVSRSITVQNWIIAQTGFIIKMVQMVCGQQLSNNSEVTVDAALLVTDKQIKKY